MMRAFWSLAALALGVALAGCGSDSTRPTQQQPPPPSDSSLVLRLDPVATGLSSPTYLASPPSDSRLFVVEQPGRIRIIQNGQLLATPFLDISARVQSGGERGLLSVAFHPRYAQNGFFYVYFTDLTGTIRIERFHATPAANTADASSSLLVLSIPHPSFANHNGGLLQFGLDGMLYAGVGDGGSAGDPFGNAQNKNALLGKLLRLDVDGGTPYRVPADNPFANQSGARGEIWAYGLRNPWRYAFDRTTGDLYIADVGQDQREEIDVQPATKGGVNYGWNIMEGTRCYATSSCDQTGFTPPVIDYDHTQGCSITGGFVYRGSAIPELAGTYFFSDYCSGFLHSIHITSGASPTVRDWGINGIGNVTSFGLDASGEIYVLTASGTVYRITRG